SGPMTIVSDRPLGVHKSDRITWIGKSGKRTSMRSTLVACGALAIIAAFALTGYFAPRADAATGPIPLNCNRACLENLVDQYLAAVVAHDSKRLPLSKDAKYTENNQVLDWGDGF